MDLHKPISPARLTESQKAVLKKGNIQSLADLLLAPLQDVTRKCRISVSEVRAIVESLCDSEPTVFLPRRLDNIDRGEERCTTGDTYLDEALGGGIRTGMIWEVFGESAAGKTQFALQLSLFIQNPPELGGLSGSACYLTTSSKLPTGRLLEMLQSNELLSPSNCSLEHVHTISTPTAPMLQHVLNDVLPAFVEQRASISSGKPVKLLVIDALAELFRSTDKTTTSTLVERAKHIAEISTLLHSLANVHHIAVLVLNEVADVFDRGQSSNETSDLIYSQQSRWFNTCDSVPGENKKEASLGLVWANQVNARIMLSRTGRRRYFDDGEIQSKRQKIEGQSTATSIVQNDSQVTSIRRLSIIFSSVSVPRSLDYVVTKKGISVLPVEVEFQGNGVLVFTQEPMIDHKTSGIILHSTPAALTESLMQDEVNNAIENPPPLQQDVDWDKFWDEDETFQNVDWDELERGLTQIPQ